MVRPKSIGLCILIGLTACGPSFYQQTDIRRIQSSEQTSSPSSSSSCNSVPSTFSVVNKRFVLTGQDLASNCVNTIVISDALNNLIPTEFTQQSANSITFGPTIQHAFDLNTDYTFTLSSPSHSQQVSFIARFAIDENSITNAHIQDGSITAMKLDSMGANDGDILKWDQLNNEWVPAPDMNLGSGTSGTVVDVYRGIGFTNSGTSITSTGTLAIDVGNTANKILQLDGSGYLNLVKNVHIASTNKLMLNNSGASQNFSIFNDGSLKVRDETGNQTRLVLASNGNLTAGGNPVCLQDGTNCPSPNPSDITSVVAGTGLTGGAVSGDATLNVNVGTGANQIVQLDASGRLPAVDGSLLTNLPFQGTITSIVAGTAMTGGAVSGDATLNVDVGTNANQILQLDASGKLPAVDGSLLTNLPAQGDITAVVAGTSLLGGGVSGDISFAVDYGTTANKIVRLNSSGQIPALDGSLLTGLMDVTGVGGGAGPNPAPGGGCPTGYIPVPGDAVYGTSSFCVMKYEAKGGGNKGVRSVPTGIPLRHTVSLNTALPACRNLGLGYALINNNEWMTIAANVVQQGSNWSSGSVGTGCVFGGHSDNNPAAPLDATADDTQGWYGTGDSSTDVFECPFNATIGASDGQEQRRTFTLSNGQVIWDLAGNIWELNNGFIIAGKLASTNSWNEISSYTTANNTAYMTVAQLRPLNALQNWWNDTWNSSNGMGQFYPGLNSSGGVILRGGLYTDGGPAGIYALTLNTAPNGYNSNIGFRCVFRPAVGGP